MAFLLIVALLIGTGTTLCVSAYGAGDAGSARSTSPSPAVKKSTTKSKKRRTARRRYSPWQAPNYANSSMGDRTDGDDPVVRGAALEALGRYNGSVLVADANTGRVLTIVNQKVAFQDGYIPCSTIKVPVALAALSEGVIDRTTKLRIYGSTRMDMTEALATSNNLYFEHLGRKLGFEKVRYYHQLFGLGEKAGLNITEEQPGRLPDGPPKNGVGRMCSFGEGITVTPLQYAGLLGAIANGGTLYYLQYPRSEEEVSSFVPRIKRRLDIQQWIPEVKPGLMGAVAFGTAQRIGFDPNEPILGKTGTCTDYDSRTHMGWFGSINEHETNRLAVVVMLTGGSAVSGPVAAGVAGQVFRKLTESGYFDRDLRYSPVALIQRESCCAAR